jgi:hypothetical protein
MDNPTPQLLPGRPAGKAPSVPDSQTQALNRRHRLDDQQRRFRGPVSALPPVRPRPPG